MQVTHDFIAQVLPDADYYGIKVADNPTWSFDSRTVQAGDIFIARKGLRLDGHDFIESALIQGIKGCLIARQHYKRLESILKPHLAAIAVIVVDEPEKAFITLATAWRQKFSYPVIGITGSVGKTTTKETLYKITQLQGMNVLISQGNQNSLCSLARVILTLNESYDCAIFEMGISKRREMARLAELVRPTIGVITAIGHSHMEGIGSLQDIATEKRDIFKFFKPEDIGVINGDTLLLSKVSYHHPTVRFGSKMINQVQARKINSDENNVQFQLKVYQERTPITLPTENKARIYNVLAAAAVATILKIPLATIAQAIQEPLTVNGRFEKKIMNGTQNIIINDSHNASPESMKAALTAFDKISTPAKKIAVLGDMLELGVNSSFWHRQLGRFLKKTPTVQHVVLVGKHIEALKKTLPLGLSYSWVASWDEAVAEVKKSCHNEQALILVKASRGIGLNNLVDALTKLPHELSA